MPGFDDIRLETERLILRPPRREDFDAWAAFMADEEATRHIGGTQSRPLAWRSFLGMVGAWHVQGFAMFTVIDKASGRWAGRVGPWCPEGWPGTEVGWSLAREFWGRGYAAEAATAAIDWAFDTLGWTEVIHTIAVDNRSSKALAARLGSTCRGPVQMPPPHDKVPAELWDQSVDEWRRRRDG